MLSAERLAEYRRMSTGERLALTLRLIEEATPWFFYGQPEVVDRRFELVRRENDERNRRMLATFRQLKPDP